MERKLDIFDVLSKLDTKKFDYLTSLPEAQQKAFMPLVVMRWMSGTKDPRQITFLNEFVNPYVFQFTKDRDLMFKLMASCSDGRKHRYVWNKKTPQSSTPNSLKVIKQYFNYSTREAKMVLDDLNNNDIMQFAEELGFQKEEINNLKKELKKR